MLLSWSRQYFRFSVGKCSGNSIVNEAGSMNEMITNENSPCIIYTYA